MSHMVVKFHIEGEDSTEQDPSFWVQFSDQDRHTAGNTYREAFERFKKYLIERVDYRVTIEMRDEPMPGPSRPVDDADQVPEAWRSNLDHFPEGPDCSA